MKFFSRQRSRKRASDYGALNSLALEVRKPRMILSTVLVLAVGSQGIAQTELPIDLAVVATLNFTGEAFTGQLEAAAQIILGDANGDGVLNNQDIGPFGQALFDPIGYATAFPNVDPDTTLDFSGNGLFDNLDIAGFASALALTGGSEVTVRARGDEGVEQFNLLIAGSVVASRSVTTEFADFVHNATDTVTANDVRIEFLNDFYDPANGIDNNLVVDFISIDGQVYQTEDPSVYSTGTWVAGVGLAPGFWQSEFLHSNGYFQYASSTIVDGGDLRLDTSVYSVSEGGGFIEVQIIRENGSEGAVTIEYDTLDLTALAGLDYTAQAGVIAWADGESGIRTVQIPIIDDALIELDKQFGFTIDNPTGWASLLVPRTATITIDDNDSVAGLGDGLLGEYFDNQDLTNGFLFRTDDTVNFDWGNGAPASGMGSNTFSVRWTGQIEAHYNETYTFQTISNDGIRLWIDDGLIIDQWNDHATTAHTGSIALEAGVRTDMRMEFYENTGNAVAQLRWSSASQPLEVVPQSQLYAADDPPPISGSELVAQTIVSGLANPTSLDWSPDGTNMYITQQNGVVRVMHDGIFESTPFIDISNIVNGTRDRGLLDIAIHPDFENTPYVYLLFTYDPPEVYQYSGLAGLDGKGNRAGRLIRVTADADDDYKTAVAGSEEILLGTNSTWDNFNGFVDSTGDFDEPPAGINPDGSNIQDFIASDSQSHTVGAIAFGLDGNLFVSIGDGTSYNAVDPRSVRVQDIDNLSGKILRIDPITGEGLPDNPFYRGDADENRAKVYQSGLRNPFRITVDPVSGQLYIGDVGWTQWEEVNAGEPGANFGWPYYEGGSGVSLQTNGYQNLPEAQVFYANGQTVTPSIYALNHNQSGINAIILGDVYTGSTYPAEYVGDLFFNDLGQGIVRNISFDENGSITNVQTFSGGVRIVVHIQEGPDGNLYHIDLNDGQVGRWVFQ